jgi:puromycin-sensitive aminopeptidase
MKKAKRLLEQIVPHHYKLHLEPDFSDFSFNGKEVVTFELKQPSGYLEFHALDLNVASAAIKHQTAASIDYKKDDQSVIIKFPSELTPGVYDLELSYAGVLREDLHGFYRSSYVHNGQEKWLATTQFESTSAREAFVCIDEPAAKATFDISLTVSNELTVISNTNPSSVQVEGDRKTVEFSTTPKMSTYLLAFLVGEFERITTKTKEGVEVGVYTTPGKVELGRFALEAGSKILSFYTDYFGIAYPLPKLDMVAVPDFAAGAMENWGVVTYRETAILVDDKNTALLNKQHVTMVIAHELAHQWFGNLVTMSWWTDLWLNEGFASWVEYLACEYLNPEWQMWTQFISDDYMHARELDALANTHPIEVEVHDPAEIDEIFDAISYQKGASVINMLYHFIGEEAFKNGLHNYLEHFSFGNAVTADLWRFLEEAANKPVRRIMQEWTSKPGFPLVSLDNQGNLKQERFFANPNEKRPDKAIWPIPFALRTDEGQTEPVLLDKTEDKINLPRSQWLKPNPGQTGVYIASYSPSQIDALGDALVNLKLPVVDRLGVVSDITALAQANKLGGEQVLKLLAQMRNETDFAVWNAMLDGLGQLMLISDDNLHDQLEKFALWLAQPRLNVLGWEPKASESHFDALLRPRILGLAGRCGDDDVIAECRKRFALHMEGRLIPADLRGSVYSVVARHGDADDYDKLFELYKSSDLQEEQRRILGALTGFYNQKLCDRILETSLSKDVRSQDSVIVIMRVLGNRVGREQAWKFVQDSWDQLIKRYGQGGHLLSYVPQGLEVFADHKRADDVAEFFATHPAPGIERTVRQAVERIRLQADWFERDEVALKRFLTSVEIRV